MTAAIVVVHARNGFFVIDGGLEFALLVGVVASVVAMVGPGRYSIDATHG
jgi:putative oxidoreductase